MKVLISALLANWQGILAAGLILLGAISAMLLAAYNVALLIPGEQPDKAIKWLYDFTSRWSSKPSVDGK